MNSSFLRNRRVLLSAAVCVVAMALLAAATALAVCVPTSYSVTSSAPPPIGNWTDTTGAVWSPTGGFPGCAAGDTASDTNGSPTTLIINSAIPNPIIGLNLNCTGCSIDIQSGGQLTLAGTGSIGSATTIIVEPGGTLTLQSGAILTVANSASLSVNGGYVDVQSGATLTLNGASTATNSGTLNVNGTMDVNNTFTVQSTGEITLGGATVDGSSSINNDGTIYQSGSDSTITAALNNNSGGSVVVMSGALHVSGGGTGDGPFTIDAGATLDFPANYTTTANGTMSGAGTLEVSGGTLSIGGVTTVGGFTETSGTLTGAGFLSVTSSWNWDGGTITGSGGRQLAGGAMGYFTGNSSALVIDGTSVDIYGYVVDTAANGMTLQNGATMSVYGTFDIQNDTSIADGGGGTETVNVAPNGYLLKSGGASTSTIATQFNNSATVYGGSGTLQIAGSGTDSGSFFNTAGSTITFSAPLTNASGYFTGNGTFAFPIGSMAMSGTYQSTGTTSISGGVLTIGSSGSNTTSQLLLSAGQLTVNGTFEIANGGTWSAGTIAGSGTVTLDSGGSLAINGADGNANLSGVEFDNNGTVTYTAPAPNEFQMSGSLLVNSGTFDIQTDQPIAQGVIVASAKPPAKARKRSLLLGAASIQNDGTFQKSAGSGTTNIDPTLTNTATVNALSGTMSFSNTYDQTGGSTNLSGGNITVASPLTLDGGALTGTGTITGDVQNNSGTVTPGTPSAVGTVTITGNYTQASTGGLSIKIAGDTSADQLAVGAAATLDGTFTASFLNPYVAPTGVSWTALTFASRTGDFATYNLPSDPYGAAQSSYTPTSLVLSIAPASTDLALGMTGPASVNANATASYDITVSNLGPDTATGTITVADTLPPGATLTGTSGTGWSCGAPSGGVVTCTNSAGLANGSSLPTLTISVAPPPNAASITNGATVSTTTSDPNASNNSASVTTTVVPQANLAITKSGPAGVTAGSNVTYTITVTNNGPSSANSVTVSDPTPANLTFVSNSNGCTSAFPCSLGTLTSGQSVTITSTFSTSGAFSGNVTNTATVSSATNDPDGSNNSASATTNVGLQADLSISKSGTPSAVPGQTVTYTINFTNGGPSPATNTTITDVTPAGLAFVSNSGACTTQFPCNVGTLNSGQSGTITSTYTVAGNYTGASITNNASISSDVNDPAPSNNSASATTTVIQQTDVAITKSGPPSASAGGNIVYTITVSNLGPSAAANVAIADPTPAGLTFVSNSGACTTAFPCNIGILGAGQTATVTSTFSIPANYAGTSVTNTATVSTSANDANPTNDSSTVITPIATASGTDVGITKSGPASISVGSNISYTITVTNNGTATANNVFVTDATPAGTTFISNSGGCTTTFPCALGALAAGQSVTITSTYNVPQNYAGATVTNTANVSTSTPDPNPANDSATAITPVSSTRIADLSITKHGPSEAGIGTQATFTIMVFNAGPNVADNVVISDPTPAGLTFVSNSGACTSAFPCTIASLAPGQSATVTAKYLVNNAARGSVTNTASVTSSATDPNTSNNSSTAGFRTSVPACPSTQTQLIAPAPNANVLSPVTLSWTAVPHATSYLVTVTGANGAPLTMQTNNTSISVDLPGGGYTWFVASTANNCPATGSSSSTFNVCSAPAQPAASVVGEATTGQTYSVQWGDIDGARSYELQEANDPSFANATTIAIPDGTSNRFTKNVTAATPFFYRVRAISLCSQLVGPYSDPVAVVVVPTPDPNTPGGPSVTAPFGSTQPITLSVFIPGLPGGTTSFIATTDRPWMSVLPTSGFVPPQGITLNVSVDPTGLANGTWTGDVVVVYGSTTISGKFAPQSTPSTVSAPVSISIVTPVSPGKLNPAAANALIIPNVGHISGLASEWRSDVRVANTSAAPMQFLLVFNPGNGTPTKQTTITVDSGATTALDDIARNWFGIGSMGDSAAGALIVQPLVASRHVAPNVSVATTAVVTSRTYNAAANGTVGQFIPAVPFANFLDAAGGSSLILQQVAQSDAFHTNLGILEAAGAPAQVEVDAFDASGNKLLTTPLSLNAGELKQLGSYLAQNNVTLTNGRIEVKPLSGAGKVTAYASVVDNKTTDPFLVSGVALNTTGATRFIVPGIADLNTGNASWRSDVRIFNGGAAPQSAMLTFYPIGNAGAATSQSITINPGEVKALDGVLQSTFGVTNAGGTLHVTTASAAPLIVSARTYDQTSSGTLGQFIPATTLSDSVGNGDRALQLVQLEDSPRYRTNLGIAEVNGKPTTVEVQVVLPNSKVSPKAQLTLGAYDSRQFDILGSLGLGSVYNARVSVRVIDGDGKITAYGSVIDQKTQAPVYVPAQ